MDGVLADFKSALTKISPELIDEFAGQHDNIPGIFSLMEPVLGAIEAVYALKDKIRFIHFIFFSVGKSDGLGDKLAWGEKIFWWRRSGQCFLP